MSLFNTLASGMRRTDIHRLGVRELRKDVSSLLLAVETIQRILADKGICSGEDFVKRMRAIDAEDGQLRRR